jgi:hypothetical protein
MTPGGKLDPKEVFVALVREFAANKRPVSSNVYARNYAPRVFEKLPRDQSRGFRKADFATAMEKLLKAKTIENVSYGRPSDERTKIAIRDLQTAEPTPSGNTDAPPRAAPRCGTLRHLCQISGNP